MRCDLVMAFTLAWLAAAPAVHAGSVTGVVAIGAGKSAESIVYLEGSESPPPPSKPVVMDQKNLEFLPKLLPIARGTTVEFTNSDDIQHNVFSPSSLGGPFDLGTYGPGDASRVTLNEIGEVVVLCNIHMEMQARIVVLPQPYFAVAGTDGRYRIAGVPAGSYTVKVWRGRFLKQAKTVTVPVDGEVTVDLPADE